MAITKTRTLQRLEVYPVADTTAADTENSGNPTIMVNYNHVFDDSTDSELPAATNQVKHLHRYVVTHNDDGTTTSTATDVTGELQLVQDVAAALWS